MGHTSLGTVRYASMPDAYRLVREPPPRPPKLLDRVREALRLRHASRSTEKAYVAWIRRFIFFHGKRHPGEMGAPEVTRFLSSLAVEGRIAASTQNQALSALLFLYRHVLNDELPWLDDIVRARRPKHLPTVLTRGEVRAVIFELDGAPRLMATLLYGSGLRLLECCRLRVQDVDFARSQIVVREGKGAKDRVTVLPAVAKDALIQLAPSDSWPPPTVAPSPDGVACPRRAQPETQTRYPATAAALTLLHRPGELQVRDNAACRVTE